MTTLYQFYKTCGSRDDLVGLEVVDTITQKSLYIKSVEDGLWCGGDRNDDRGRFYDMSRLVVA